LKLFKIGESKLRRSGRTPLLARDIMTPNPLKIDMDAKIRDAAKIMCENKVGSLLVVDSKGSLRGIITERDILCAAAKEGCCDMPVWTIMTENPVVVSMNAPIDDVIRKMTEIGVRHLPVVDEKNNPVGIISARDVLAALRAFHELLLFRR
jgi:CBS domain-containing protein